ncbi:MAG: hypothetical protein HDR26_04225 [Lachnospiraceae bacterium]|nr:hypothetical protein [Lachnospiraceae bacterium]
MKVKAVNKIKKAIWLLAALGWWGVLYPELSLTQDTCRIVWTEDMQPEEELSQTQIYYRLLSAEPEQIKIKSRLLEILASYFEKDKGK